jgi:LruC domain-containing protein
MKTLKIISSLLLTMLFVQKSSAQTLATIDAESGNRGYDQANCWAFGSFTPSSSSKINGNYSYRGNSASNASLYASFITAPWCKFASGGTITLKAKLDAANGTFRRLVFSYYTYDSTKSYGQGSLVRFDSVNYTTITTNTQNISIKIPSAIVSNDKVYAILISAFGSGGSSRWILDDINISNTTYWANPSKNCLPLSLITDSDNDGVQDSDDAYPKDAARAYNNYFPAKGYGTLMFEDLWPSLGDYDFNDLVLGYKRNTVTNASNKVVEVKMTYIIKAVGAANANGFGIQFDNLDPSKIAGVKGVKTKGAKWLSVSGNGTENNQKFANIIIFDNVNEVMPNAGGSLVNTNGGAPYVTPDTTEITIVFSNDKGKDLSLDEIRINPYIIVNQDRTKEIHLPKFEPTNLASTKLFGQSNDNTNLEEKTFYTSKENNLPWALDVPAEIPYMMEREDFITGYLDFVKWAQSNGQYNKDWYDPNKGKRDYKKIY